MTVVSLAAARKLHALGWPQDRWPQMVYLPDGWGGVHCRLHYQPTKPRAAERGAIFSNELWCLAWYVAPDVLSVLDWLEERGWCVDLLSSETARRLRLQGRCVAFLGQLVPGVDPIYADTPTELIEAILARLLTAERGAK